MKKLNRIDYMIVMELVKNAKISDRVLAKKIGVSQPTVTRRRTAMEKSGLLKYTALLDYPKFGFELMALNFFQFKSRLAESLGDKRPFEKRVQEFIASHPHLIFVASGRGLGMTRMGITIHRNYADYEAFANAVDNEWGMYLARFESFIISLRSKGLLRFFDFTHLTKHMMEVHAEQMA
ncbi:MAG: Lrp/AsnC family transcriptional regulator [Candidatus Bathyarchaeota archaeon]|nr:MAG: Lrp/AsnC family transcriptional regulator [Candidatus Bathyarchaeota archaeon]